MNSPHIYSDPDVNVSNQVVSPASGDISSLRVPAPPRLSVSNQVVSPASGDYDARQHELHLRGDVSNQVVSPASGDQVIARINAYIARGFQSSGVTSEW